MYTTVLDQLADFRCAAGSCPFTCCAYWTIQVDSKTDELYRSQTGEFGEFLNRNIDRERTPPVMKLIDGRCAMLNEEGLCRIQLRLGEEALCDTCTIYPRIIHTFGDYRFLYTTLSCPEACRELLSRRDSLLIVSGGETEEGEPTMEGFRLELAFAAFNAGIDILQDRACGIAQRQRLLIMLNRALQDALDASDYDECRELLAFFSVPENYRSLAGEALPCDPAAKLRLLQHFSVPLLEQHPRTALSGVFRACLEFLRGQEGGAWMETFSAFLREWNGGEGEIEQEQVMIYAMFGHFMGMPENWSPFRSAALVVIFAQLHRVFSALLSVRDDGKTVPFDERVLCFSFLSRFLEHVGDATLRGYMDHLESHGALDLEFLFRLIS